MDSAGRHGYQRQIMARDTDPLLTVVYPIVDVRGRAADRVRTWTQGQTLARDRYRVVVHSTAPIPCRSRTCGRCSVAGDELFSVPGADDAELWNAGAARAGTPWLV